MRVYPKLLLDARGQVEEIRKVKMLEFVSLDPIFRYARNQWTFIHCDLVSLYIQLRRGQGGLGGSNQFQFPGQADLYIITDFLLFLLVKCSDKLRRF